MLADDEVQKDGKAFANFLPLKTKESLPLFAVRSLKNLRFCELLLGKCRIDWDDPLSFSSFFCFPNLNLMLVLSMFFFIFSSRLSLFCFSPPLFSFFFFSIYLTACLYSQARNLETSLNPLSSQPSLLGNQFQPLDHGKAPSASSSPAGTGGTKPFPLAVAILACKRGLFCAVQGREKCQKRKWQETAAEEGKGCRWGYSTMLINSKWGCFKTVPPSFPSWRKEKQMHINV